MGADIGGGSGLGCGGSGASGSPADICGSLTLTLFHGGSRVGSESVGSGSVSGGGRGGTGGGDEGVAAFSRRRRSRSSRARSRSASVRPPTSFDPRSLAKCVTLLGLSWRVRAGEPTLQQHGCRARVLAALGVAHAGGYACGEALVVQLDGDVLTQPCGERSRELARLARLIGVLTAQ